MRRMNFKFMSVRIWTIKISQWARVNFCSYRKIVFCNNIENIYTLLGVLLSNINLLLTEREGRTGEYWPEVVAVQTERSEVRTETTEGQYSPVRLELARLVSSLLYGIRAMLVLNLPAWENKNTQLMTVSMETTLPYNN